MTGLCDVIRPGTIFLRAKPNRRSNLKPFHYPNKPSFLFTLRYCEDVPNILRDFYLRFKFSLRSYNFLPFSDYLFMYKKPSLTRWSANLDDDEDLNGLETFSTKVVSYQPPISHNFLHFLHAGMTAPQEKRAHEWNFHVTSRYPP